MNEPPMPQDSSLGLSLAQVVDPVCDRFEAAWKAWYAFAAPAGSGGLSGSGGPRTPGTPGTPSRPRVEDFLGAATGPERAVLLRELVLLEIYYHRRAGECPTADAYRVRFPELEEKWLANAVTAQAEPASGSPGVSTDLQVRGATSAERSAPGARRSSFLAGGMADGEGGIPQRLGEYRILREVGRGGMGVVYEAADRDDELSCGLHTNCLRAFP